MRFCGFVGGEHCSPAIKHQQKPPLVRGGGKIFDFDGGVVVIFLSLSHSYLVTAPSIRGSLFLYINPIVYSANTNHNILCTFYVQNIEKSTFRYIISLLMLKKKIKFYIMHKRTLFTKLKLNKLMKSSQQFL